MLRLVLSAPSKFVIPRPVIPQQWECSVPVRDGRATAYWWFGDEPNESLTMHFEVNEAGEVFRVDTTDFRKPSRIGFRQESDDD